MGVKHPSLEGRTFVDVTPNHAGDVGAATLFEYHEEGDLIWARYAGGSIRLGYLVGTRDGDSLAFSYTHVTEESETASGHCVSTINTLPDGRLECHEQWQWDSRAGAGHSVIREVAPS